MVQSATESVYPLPSVTFTNPELTPDALAVAAWPLPTQPCHLLMSVPLSANATPCANTRAIAVRTAASMAASRRRGFAWRGLPLLKDALS